MESLYNATFLNRGNVLNTGFNYTTNGILLKKTVSPYLFQNNDLYEFLSSASDAFAKNIDSVKRIRIHNNFSVDKDYKKIN